MEIDNNFFTPIYAEKLVLENFPKNCKKVLDFGCGDGHFTIKLASKADEVYGCDIDNEQVALLKEKKGFIKYFIVKPEAKTLFPNGYFDCITLMGVLEHVRNEKKLLNELHRILKKRDYLFIYGINKGLLGFLDAANLKFIAPQLHKSLYKFFYSRQDYEKKFVESKKGGMFGDFTLGKGWHTHYSLSDLTNLTAQKYVIDGVWRYSFFLPLILMLEFILVKLFKKSIKFTRWLIEIDSLINLGPASYCFVVRCQKI